MTATDCIPITLPRTDWLAIWNVLAQQRYEGKHNGKWLSEPVHAVAVGEIVFRGQEAQGADWFTCFLMAGDVWYWARSMTEEIAGAVRRQVEAYYTETW